MELLPRDVIGIVHRYLLRHTYDAVVRQYKLIWLNNDDPDGDYNVAICWDDEHMCFKTWYRLVANFRDPTGIYWVTIGKFYTHEDPDETSVVPDRY
jgi:hypothetical protein